MSEKFSVIREDFDKNYSNILKEMKEDYRNSKAQKEGTKIPKDGTKKSKTLAYLWQHRGEIVPKTILNNLFNPGCDNQNARHLGRQDGFNILQWGDKYGEERLSSGTYIFTSFEETHSAWSLNRRRCDPAIDWETLKLLYDYKCACCTCIEGKSCKFNKEKILTLEKGHRDPDLPLEKENIIPLCQDCNRYYQNKVKFNSQGLITHFRGKDGWSSLRER